jgi:molybdenum cofactor cytidylyltransferase
MYLSRALRLKDTPILAFTGSGGKTTALFHLARELSNGSAGQKEANPVLVTSTTHLGLWQTPLADQHIIARGVEDLIGRDLHGVTLVTGEIEGDRTRPVNDIVLIWLREIARERKIALLIEADGAKQKPLKAPASHEPPTPDFVNTVVVVAGLLGLGRSLSESDVHRAEIFSRLAQKETGSTVLPADIVKVLTHPLGGLKNIPPTARCITMLNQADTDELRSVGGRMTGTLLDAYDSVLLTTFLPFQVQTFEPIAGIILAAGGSTRYKRPKQLLEWKGKPFVRHVAETALQAGLQPVNVVTGAYAAEVESALNGLAVRLLHNPDYHDGQSTSIRKGLGSLPRKTGGALFLLADQPQIPASIIKALVETRSINLPAILAPLVLDERRANPVLFDLDTFPDLMQLTGDVGGRAIFDKHKVEYLPWHDDRLLLDVDTPEDYSRLIRDETL